MWREIWSAGVCGKMAPVPVAADVRLFIGAGEMGRFTAKLLAQAQLERRLVLAALTVSSLVTAVEERKKKRSPPSFSLHFIPR